MAPLVTAALAMPMCVRSVPIYFHVSGGQALGDRVLRPFLQDTVRWWPLTVTMAGTLLAAPLTIARVLAQACDTENSVFSICSRDMRFVCLVITPAAKHCHGCVLHTCPLPTSPFA